MRNYQQRTEQFNDRIITREQGGNGKVSWKGGMQNDIPNPGPDAERDLQDYLCFPDRLEPRCGNKVYSNTVLPSLPGRTGYTLTKTGTTVTKTVGNNFTGTSGVTNLAVGDYIVFDDGKHERITVVTSTTQVTVDSDAVHATSTAAWFHGPLYMEAYHKKNARIVIQIDTRFFISSTIGIAAWYQIFMAGQVAPAASFSTYDEMGDYLVVFNANGIFKLDTLAAGTGAAPCIYFRANETIGTLYTASDATADAYVYRYISAYTRIKGTSLSRNRNDSTIELQSAPSASSYYNGLEDYWTKKKASAIASGAGIASILTDFGGVTRHFTHKSLYRTLDIGVNGTDPQTGIGNNTELYVWVADIPLNRSFVVSRSTTTLTASAGTFFPYDVGTFIQLQGGDNLQITAYISATQVTVASGTNTNESAAMYSGTPSTGSQAVSGSETVGNATVTKTGGTVFQSSDVGKEIVWPNGTRSLIVRYITNASVEVAQSTVIASTAFVIPVDASGPSYYDEVPDDTLRQLSAGYCLQNRLMAALPNADIGGVSGGMIWTAVRGYGDIKYSQIPNNEEYYGGYYRAAGDGAQIDKLPDAIYAIGKFSDRIVFYCSQTSWYIPTNDFSTVTVEEIGEVIAVVTGHYPVASIGINDYSSLRRIDGVKVSDQQKSIGDIMYCHDGSVRICDGSQMSGDLSMNRIKKTLLTQTNKSSATYDPINGYMLWRNDGTINDSTHSYRYGVEPSVQGIGWSKNLNGDWPMTFSRIGGLVISDANGYFHSLILDRKTGLFYDMATYDGPAGSGIIRLSKDKVASDGTTGGTDIAPIAEFIPEMGDKHCFTVEHKESHFSTRPFDETDGYPSGLIFTIQIFKNSETTYTAQAASVTQDNDIYFDKKVEGNQLRIRISANKAGHYLVSRLNYFLAKDRAATPANRTSSEKTYQKTLNTAVLWVSPCLGKVINRVNGDTVIVSPTLTTGPDGYSDSGIQISAALTCGSFVLTSQGLIIWADGTVAITVGGTPVILTSHGTVGFFTLYYGVATGNGNVIVTPTGTVVISDIRVLTGSLDTTERTYYFNDVNTNSGKIVMPR